jgi:Outer membrane protein beta-barrel domain
MEGVSSGFVKSSENYARLLLVIFIVGLTSAPVSAESELGIAAKSGPNAAALAAENRTVRYGVSGGLAGYLRWPLSDQFSVAGQIEMLYTPRGTDVIIDDELLGRFRQHYLDLAVTARPAARLGPASFYLVLGGGLNLLLSANRKDPSGESQDITDGLRRVDVALIAGAGVAFHFSRRDLGPFQLDTLFLEARHEHGLISVDAMNDGIENRNSSLMLGVSFVLSRGGKAAPAVQPVQGAPPIAAAVPGLLE